MKNYLSFLLVSAAMLLSCGCSSQQFEDLANTTCIKNNSLITRGSADPSSFLDDKGMEIVKADLIGAFEGAYRGLDYAMKENLDEETAITIVITSAIMHAVARSHQAYINYDKFHFAFQIPNSEYETSSSNVSTSDLIEGPSLEYTPEYHQDIVRVSESDLINEPMQEWSSIEHILSITFPNAALVGRKHNAILAALENQCDINSAPDYDTILKTIPEAKSIYIDSPDLYIGISKTIKNPFFFYIYPNLTEESSHLESKKIISKFMTSITSNGRSLENYNNLLVSCINSVVSRTDLTAMEKESIYMGLIVGKFSMHYWLKHL